MIFFLSVNADTDADADADGWRSVWTHLKA